MGDVYPLSVEEAMTVLVAFRTIKNLAALLDDEEALMVKLETFIRDK